MIRILSIVHGAKRIYRRKGYFPRWPEKMKSFMAQKQFDFVVPYYWLGNPLEAFTKAGAKRYAKHLNLYLSKIENSDRFELYIYTKSVGAFIAENGLYQYNRCYSTPITVKKILRVAVPDKRSSIIIPYQTEVVDVFSEKDKMVAVTAPFTFLLFKAHNRHNDGFEIFPQRIEVKLKKHSDFNINHPIELAQKKEVRLFDYYYCLIK